MCACAKHPPLRPGRLAGIPLPTCDETARAGDFGTKPNGSLRVGEPRLNILPWAVLCCFRCGRLCHVRGLLPLCCCPCVLLRALSDCDRALYATMLLPSNGCPHPSAGGLRPCLVSTAAGACGRECFLSAQAVQGVAIRPAWSSNRLSEPPSSVCKFPKWTKTGQCEQRVACKTSSSGESPPCDLLQRPMQLIGSTPHESSLALITLVLVCRSQLHYNTPRGSACGAWLLRQLRTFALIEELWT